MRESITCVLALLALVASVAQLMGRCPSGVASLLLSLVALLACMPR